MDNIITIFTPTYNRGEKLKKLKSSLQKQTDLDFKWIIIDDGSEDNTKSIVKDFIDENKLDITYYYQENHGKHVAHNRGVQMCKTELFYCVDSDDLLPNNAIQQIKQIWNECDDKKSISGIVGIKAFYDYNVVGNYFPEDVKRASLLELCSEYGKKGDTALIWRTEVLKEYPFKVFENENFLRENTAYDLIAKKYKMAVTNKIIYLCEYFEDGLSANATKLEFKNPKGAAYYRLLEAKKQKNILKRMAYYSGYVFYCNLGDDKENAIKQIGVLKYEIYNILSIFIKLRYKLRGVKI